MKLLITLSFLGLFSITHSWAQVDSTLIVENKPEYIEDFRIEELAKRYAANYKDQKIDGYRVQLYSGQRVSANEIRKKAIGSFPKIETELTYSAPDYKVQMGNYRTELEAVKQLQLIRNTFPGAFVVLSKIDLPQLFIEEQN